jgi:hypothetical protein
MTYRVDERGYAPLYIPNPPQTQAKMAANPRVSRTGRSPFGLLRPAHGAGNARPVAGIAAVAKQENAVDLESTGAGFSGPYAPCRFKPGQPQFGAKMV